MLLAWACSLGLVGLLDRSTLETEKGRKGGGEKFFLLLTQSAAAPGLDKLVFGQGQMILDRITERGAAAMLLLESEIATAVCW